MKNLFKTLKKWIIKKFFKTNKTEVIKKIHHLTEAEKEQYNRDWEKYLNKHNF